MCVCVCVCVCVGCVLCACMPVFINHIGMTRFDMVRLLFCWANHPVTARFQHSLLGNLYSPARMENAVVSIETMIGWLDVPRNV